MKKTLSHPFYPLLFAVYPIFAFLSINIREVPVNTAFRPLGISILGGVIIFFLLRLLFRDWSKAAFLCLLILIVFYSYGHIYQLLKNILISGVNLGRHRILVPFFFCLFIVAFKLSSRIRTYRNINIFLNIFAIYLFFIPVFKISSYYLLQSTGNNLNTEVDKSNLSKESIILTPDIYYIIPDTYARKDALLTLGFENSEFINSLINKGFYVTECSQSNYFFTSLSLASSLNMNYIPELGSEFLPGNPDQSILDGFIKHGKVRTFLEELGYSTVAFYTGYYWSSWQDADVYLTSGIGTNYLLMNRYLTPFEAQFIRTTAIIILTDFQSILLPEFYERVNFPYYDHIQRQLYILDELKNIPEMSSPKFVFVHLLLPHYPFVFASDGTLLNDPGYWTNQQIDDYPINEEYFRKGYTQQVAYLNNRLIEIIDILIAKSKNPPIIILQGDTGAWFPYKQAILNAYYLPGMDKDILYPSISPVNSFRLIFNKYFNMNFELLPDQTYYSTQDDPYNFKLEPLINSSCGFSMMNE